MLLNPYLKGTISFPNVTLFTRAFNLVDPFVLTMVKSVFHILIFCLMAFHWFERGLDLFSSQYLGNLVCDPLNVRQISYLTRVMVVNGSRLTSFPLHGSSNGNLDVLIYVSYDS
jgi:hypothetical protein